MQSTNKAIIMGLVGSTLVWSGGEHKLFPVLVGGVVGAWAGVLPDIDSPYEFAARRAEYAPGTLALPFGKTLCDHLHSKYYVKFLHSLVGLAFLWALARASYLIPIDVYAIFETIVAIWAIFFLERLVYHTFGRWLLRNAEGKLLLLLAVPVVGILFIFPSSVTIILPPALFVKIFVVGVALNVFVEFLSATGAPLLWPLRWKLRIPLIGETAGKRENLVVFGFCFWWFLWTANPKFHRLMVSDFASFLSRIHKPF